MDRLETKKVNGQTYYYYAKWGWRDGKCRRLSQQYLGKPERILALINKDDDPPRYAEVFEWGLPCALWQECAVAKVVEFVDELCPKRTQGLSTGQYIALAAINRSIQAVSKASIWEWFSKTALIRHFPQASKSSLSSQRFWDHMERVTAKQAKKIWERILNEIIKRESIDLSSISYDGTNFYTFIDTFNTHCTVAKRGKNKQGRSNLRQVSYALFCASDSHIPLFYDVYDGNRNDAGQFPAVLKKFYAFWQRLSGGKAKPPDTTLVFDKGNNSKDNFELIDDYELKFVGSVKLDEHKELAAISNRDPRFVPCASAQLEGVKAIRIEKEAYGKNRSMVVTYNPNLFAAQYLTVQADINKALLKLSAIQGKLTDRRDGIITKGKKPTTCSIANQCKKILSRPYLGRIIKITIKEGIGGLPDLAFSVDTKALDAISDTYLGKTILISNRFEWDSDKIITAYRSQYIVEDVFKEMKDRNDGSWWPLFHWTDSKIRVHGLYCSIALLLRALMFRRVRKAGNKLSMKRTLGELRDIQEVVTTYDNKSRRKSLKQKTTLTKLTEVQENILQALKIEHKPLLLG